MVEYSSELKIILKEFRRGKLVVIHRYYSFFTGKTDNNFSFFAERMSLIIKNTS
jgi:hypothetical protein